MTFYFKKNPCMMCLTVKKPHVSRLWHQTSNLKKLRLQLSSFFHADHIVAERRIINHTFSVKCIQGFKLQFIFDFFSFKPNLTEPYFSCSEIAWYHYCCTIFILHQNAIMMLKKIRKTPFVSLTLFSSHFSARNLF